MDGDFILTNEVAKKLFHEHAEKLPIIDYTVILTQKRLQKTKNLKTSPNSGSAETITNGDSCVPPVWMNII